MLNRVAVVQVATGAAWERLLSMGAPLWAYWLNQQLETVRGSYHAETGRRYPERTEQWEKVAYWLFIASTLPDGALMVCADVDAIPRRIENPEGALPAACDLGMVWNESARCWNSGMLFVRLSPFTRAWLNHIWDAGAVAGQAWPGEQGRINESLGYPRGKPVKFPERETLTQCETEAGTLHVYRLNERWNAYPRVRCTEFPPVIQAWHAEPWAKREAGIEAARKHFDQTGELWRH